MNQNTVIGDKRIAISQYRNIADDYHLGNNYQISLDTLLVLFKIHMSCKTDSAFL